MGGRANKAQKSLTKAGKSSHQEQIGFQSDQAETQEEWPGSSKCKFPAVAVTAGDLSSESVTCLPLT